MNLENCISNLLYRHDCVIVPGFGAFVAQRNPSVYKQENSSFSPSSKLISFNPSLVKNDGLLIQEFMQKHRVDYVTASEQIKNGVQFWKLHLEKNASLVLENLGLFTKENGLLQFVPSAHNFLLDSFGLEDVRSKLILTQETPNSSSVVWWKVAAIVPLIVGGYLYFAKPQPVKQFVNEQWSGFVSPWVKPNVDAEKATVSVVKNVEETVKTEIKNDSYLQHDYQVIAGAFRVKSEAETMELKLREKGFENARLTQKKGSYYYVAFETFVTKDEALDYRKTVKENFPETWVLSLKE